MIDIHCHILNGLDDGPKSINESFDLLKIAKNDGIKDIICTPHYMKNKECSNFESIFTYLKKVAEEKYDINLYIGNEVLYENCSLVYYIENNLIHTLNDSRYLLFELSFESFNPSIFDEIYDLNICGYIPIIAHPERYYYICKNPNIVYQLVKKGCLVQINHDSLLGKNGEKSRETALLLLKHSLVHFVASDGHNKYRKVILKDSHDFLKGRISNQYLEDIYFKNATKVIKNEIIYGYKYSKINKIFKWFI